MSNLPQRKSPRRKEYDYTSSGVYFLTICTAGRQHYFGEIEDGNMKLNELGRFTTLHRNHISDHYPFVETQEFICMPNHIHGMIVIGERIGNRDVGTQFLASYMKKQNIDNGKDENKLYGDNQDRTYKNTSLQSPSSGSLGSIIRGYKIGITKYAKQLDVEFKRQGRYHDHVIRNEKEYNTIKHYIQTNPQNWEEDKFNT